ncbi:unnamed protein product, partial [Thlaspi arvense]
ISFVLNILVLVVQLIPIAYYNELPRLLPKTAILQGTGGCVWKVAMKLKEEELYFEQGWPKFVKDNSLIDGDFLTFVYDGDRTFEVSIYGLTGCKEIRAVAEVEEEVADSILSLSSDDTDTSSESEKVTAIPRSKNKGKSKVEVVDSYDEEDIDDTDTCSEFKTSNTVPRSKDKGKSKEEPVEDSDDDDTEDSDYSLDSEETETETDTCSELKAFLFFLFVEIFPGKKKVEVVESSDEDYTEAFGRMGFEDDSNSDSSYSPDGKDTTTHVKRNVTNPKKKGKSKVIDLGVHEVGECSHPVEPAQTKEKRKREKVVRKIKNPEAYLDDPNNVYFETGVKNRLYELLVHSQLVKDYCLKFEKFINYIHPKGKLKAKTAKWKDQRVCIKKWITICDKNKLNKKDRVLCELLRNRNLVYAIKVHIVRGKDL